MNARNIYWYKHTSLKNKKNSKIEDLFKFKKALFKALKLFQVSTLLLLQAKILNLIIILLMIPVQ